MLVSVTQKNLRCWSSRAGRDIFGMIIVTDLLSRALVFLPQPHTLEAEEEPIVLSTGGKSTTIA